ncbi:MAG: sensor histidine kinase [Alicyclobacillaceae bacterium]|nr:sensor histidine kinase [Alicyclobacillaceae bacterium]
MLSADVNRFVTFLEEERRRLARDIHDGPAQSLTSVSMRLEIVKRLIEAHRMEDARAELDRLQGLLRTAVNDTRRLVFDLRPSFLEHGVEDAIRAYANRFSQTFGIPVHVEGDWSGHTLSRAAEVTVFRVFQEALNNVHKHARATHVDVHLTVSGGQCVLTVEDDGRGFEVRACSATFGLNGIRERLALIGGRAVIQSSPGRGTKVVAEVPADVGL